MKKGQGEIFGIALLFVIIIVGFLIYAQVQALNPRQDESGISTEYRILAEGTLGSLLEMSTGCYVERADDSVRRLMSFCLEQGFTGVDPQISCDGRDEMIYACKHSVDILNRTLNELFNSNANHSIGEIPYELRINLPANPESLLNDIYLSNFGEYQFRGQTITQDNYLRNGFRRAPSGLRTWATAQRNIQIELYLYYQR